MTKDEYKQARKELGMSVDSWVKALDISINTHKSLCSGRRAIQDRVLKRIELLRKKKAKN